MMIKSPVLLLAALVASSLSAPAPAPAPAPAALPAPADDSRPEIIEIIAPANDAQETLSTLNLGAPGSEISERNKRTIGILRQLFPTLTEIIENKVQQITSMVLTTFGPTFLKLFLGNKNNDNSGGGTVELDDDDEDEDDDVFTTTSTAASRRRRSPRFYSLPGAADGNQLLSGAESQQAEVRVPYGESQPQEKADGDQQTAAQTNSATIDEITLDDADDSEENRNKRFLGGSSGGTSGLGGSGNFIFDIVRLVAGSSSGASSTDAAGGEGDDGAAKGDNLTEGVPGPITRLFIIANRGVANLIQDLILRIAQTSERIVNFKARLITSII